ncbi:2-C-methyl-D-erythritol 4-phosphate cytidylyltransferase [Secundilactobacillus similis DSM 23365 = JCM 2765]|uniref:2-C-methyl-D-erythritol 4-phosphate cytidylyltransferase n=3 Tax=Secundilactobacillus similis TaxID=414682 RepID=A0A0R2F9B3_9LACO|nr:2-C-methyl-D-erythritol 4-phosphate cytidylyltransferase [Secundilactobacillus similis DSM 23365 = JCM 2765]
MHNGALPKQFLELHGKPIIIYTLEKFEQNENIDGIVVVCVKGWERYLRQKIELFNLKKVLKILTGGETAIESQFVGLEFVKNHVKNDAETVVLLHDGVRPLIDETTINKNIVSVQNNRSAITIVPAIETIGFSDTDGELDKFVDRSKCVMARAPQSYFLSDIYATHVKAQKEKKFEFVDSATMMQHYGFKLHTVLGNTNNIKVTTPTDFYIFRAILDAQESELGLE